MVGKVDRFQAHTRLQAVGAIVGLHFRCPGLALPYIQCAPIWLNSSVLASPALQSAEGEQDQQWLVRRPFVALRPDADTVECLENLGSVHGQVSGLVGTAHLGPARMISAAMSNAAANMCSPPGVGIPSCSGWGRAYQQDSRCTGPSAIYGFSHMQCHRRNRLMAYIFRRT